MEEGGRDHGGDEIHNEPAGSETEPLLRPKPPTYLNFRIGRETHIASRCTRFVLAVFKVCFCSLGLWGHQAWNYIPRILFLVVCIYQTVYRLFIDCGCLDFDCHFVQNSSKRNTPQKDDVATGNTVFTVAAMAADISYIVLVGSFMVAKRMDSALVAPSETMTEDLNETVITVLFVTFVFTIMSLLGIGTSFYKLPSSNGLRNPTFNVAEVTGTAAQLLVHWSSINTCYVFAVSSVAIGKLSCYFRRSSSEKLRRHEEAFCDKAVGPSIFHSLFPAKLAICVCA